MVRKFQKIYSYNTRLISNYLILGISVAAGAVSSLSFAPLNLWPLGLLSIITLFWIINTQSTLLVASSIFLFWASYFFSGTWWIGLAYKYFFSIGNVHALVLFLFTVAIYALILSVPWLLVFLLRSNSAWIFCAPFLWVLSEWSRYWIMGGLTWLLAGYAHQSTWLAGWIPVFGVLGASFFLALTAALCIFFITNNSARYRVYAVFSIAIFWLSGFFLQLIDWTSPVGEKIPTTLIQPTLALYGTEFRSPEEGQKYWDQEILKFSRDQWKPGMLVWPEGALKSSPETLTLDLLALDQKAKASETAFLTGGPIFTGAGESVAAFNSIHALGEAKGKYRKSKLAPMGEYMPLPSPLNKLFPSRNKNIQAYDETEQTLIGFKHKDTEHQIASSICYEVAFGNLNFRQNSQATLLMNLSNDLWFRDSIQLDQSLQIAQIRALEQQKPMIRATMTGISATIDARGNIIDQSKKQEKVILQSSIQARDGKTPYARWGDKAILMLASVIAIFSLLIGKWSFFKRQDSSSS